MIGRVRAAVEDHLPGRSVRSVADRGVWIRHIFGLRLDDGSEVLCKLDVNPEYQSSEHEAAVLRLFSASGLPAARVLACDSSCRVVPHPFIVVEKTGGLRLDRLLAGLGERESLPVFAALGDLYGRMHGITGPRSGLWNRDPGTVLYEVSPTDYMFRAELEAGSGPGAVEKGLISTGTHEAVLTAWRDNLDYLKDHRPALIHLSPFRWTISLEGDGSGWRVTRLTSLCDVMWWDAAYDLAFLRYPPFAEVTSAQWDAFSGAYGPMPGDRRLLLYALMQRLCAVMGVYMEPCEVHTRTWIETAAADVVTFVERIGPTG